MRKFSQYQIREALAYAAAGGQALHLHRIILDEDRAPQCFVLAVRRGEDIAHLLDQDHARLCRTARALGCRSRWVQHPGTPRQHIDLCGAPLRKALDMCGADEKE